MQQRASRAHDPPEDSLGAHGAGSSSAASSRFIALAIWVGARGCRRPNYEISPTVLHTSTSTTERKTMKHNYPFHAWKNRRLGDFDKLLLRFRTLVCRHCRICEQRSHVRRARDRARDWPRFRTGQDRWALTVKVADRDREILSLGCNPKRDEQLAAAQAHLARGGTIKNVRLRRSGNAYYLTDGDR